VALIDIARNNIAKKISEKNEQRLRGKRKNRKMPNLAFRGWKTHLPRARVQKRFFKLEAQEACQMVWDALRNRRARRPLCQRIELDKTPAAVHQRELNPTSLVSGLGILDQQ
jgi:hypothetical protein